MKTMEIPIRELHARTGHFVRRAAKQGEVIITDRGKPAARLVPLASATRDATATLGDRRRLRSDYHTALAAGRLASPGDSTTSLAETAALRDL